MQSMMKMTFLLAAILMPMNTASAEELIIYPAKSQTPQQMEKDKSECYLWAKQQTGVDPAQVQLPAPPPPSQTAQPEPTAPQGGVVKGAARGAAVGAIAGSFRGEVGEGAAAGAAVGGLVGGIKQRGQQKQQAAAQQQQQQQEQVAQQEQKMNSYNKAYCACLEGRGYTVK
jgi:hypothetical protein